MSVDARTPVLVGASAVQQRDADPSKTRDAIGLMVDAARLAANDAGAPALLARASSIRIPRGIWPWPDPARLVAERIGATRARTEVAEIGILQTTLFGRACEAIREGHEDVVLVAGGEAKYRDSSASRAGLEAALTPQEPTTADTVLTPHEDIIGPAELAHGLAMPIGHYAIIENALRAAEGQAPQAHRDAIAELWAGMSAVAATNPAAWTRTAFTPADLAPGDRNRQLAYPYAKRHASDWNVDQAAVLILCAAGVARELGIPESRWIHPLAVTESNHMVPVSARPAIHRVPGFRRAGERAATIAGLSLGEVDHVELYSCFPAAVRTQQRELDVPRDRPVTQCGGMAFAGGPLNNFVLQAMVRMVAVLRDDPGSTALVTAVSGMLTKQGVSLWASRPAKRPFAFDDVTETVAAEQRPIPVAAAHTGPGTIASYTVVYDGGAPRAVAVCDVAGGTRAIASSSDPAVVTVLTAEEGCGRACMLDGSSFRL